MLLYVPLFRHCIDWCSVSCMLGGWSWSMMSAILFICHHWEEFGGGCVFITQLRQNTPNNTPISVVTLLSSCLHTKCTDVRLGCVMFARTHPLTTCLCVTGTTGPGLDLLQKDCTRTLLPPTLSPLFSFNLRLLFIPLSPFLFHPPFSPQDPSFFLSFFLLFLT